MSIASRAFVHLVFFWSGTRDFMLAVSIFLSNCLTKYLIDLLFEETLLLFVTTAKDGIQMDKLK